MGITELADTVRAGLDRLEQLARDADHGEPWKVTTDWTGPSVWINDTLEGVWTRDGIGVSAAYTCDDPDDDCREARAGYEAEARLIAERAHPARVLAEVAGKRALLDEALGWRHDVHDDSWFTCQAATDEHDGGTYAETDGGGPCTCGRDVRVLAILTHLAQPYQETT